MGMWLWFLVGFICGTLAGFFITALIVAVRDDDHE